MLSGKKQNSVSVAPHLQAQCLLSSHRFHIGTRRMHIFLRKQVFRNTSHNLIFQVEKICHTKKQYFIRALWRSLSPTERYFFFWISMLKQFTDRSLETKRAPESPTACYPKLCCRVPDTMDCSWNETVKYSNLTAPNKLLLCNLWREPASNLWDFCFDIIHCNNSTIHIYDRVSKMWKQI